MNPTGWYLTACEECERTVPGSQHGAKEPPDTTTTHSQRDESDNRRLSRQDNRRQPEGQASGSEVKSRTRIAGVRSQP